MFCNQYFARNIQVQAQQYLTLIEWHWTKMFRGLLERSLALPPSASAPSLPLSLSVFLSVCLSFPPSSRLLNLLFCSTSHPPQTLSKLCLHTSRPNLHQARTIVLNTLSSRVTNHLQDVAGAHHIRIEPVHPSPDLPQRPPRPVPPAPVPNDILQLCLQPSRKHPYSAVCKRYQTR